MSYNYYYQNCLNTQSDSDSTLSELKMKSKNRRTWKYVFIDLPCLQYIISAGYSFQNVKYVSLESKRINKLVLICRYICPSKCESTLFFSECFEEIILTYASLYYLYYRGFVCPVRYSVIGSDLVSNIHFGYIDACFVQNNAYYCIFGFKYYKN